LWELLISNPLTIVYPNNQFLLEKEKKSSECYFELNMTLSDLR